MHLIDLMAMRTIPGAGVYFSLTRRCPLSCAHCSTNSSITSHEHDGGMFLAFAKSMTVDSRPEVILLTGGEPFLRPRLIESISDHGRSVGFRTQALCGMYFARGGGRIPPPIARAIKSIDHFSASLDEFHEREVARRDVFATVDRILDWGVATSLQVTGHGADDPYLVRLVADIREHFDDQLPILATQVSPLGRAKEWIDTPELSSTITTAPVAPCDLASWPVVAFDGAIVTCCNQDVVDGADAPHLVLGHAARDDWESVVGTLVDSELLRAIRLYGPLYVSQRLVGGAACRGYCESCLSLRTTRARQSVDAHMAQPTVRALEGQLAELQRSLDPVALMGTFGIRDFAPLLRLGYEEAAACAS
jgi:pyruvate-formate lyase-activating enzyme